MDRLDAMAIFVTVVDQRSLAAAARVLGKSPATVTRAIALLESRLGERLLHRSARTLKLTESGERQLAVFRSVLAELEEAVNPSDDDGRVEGALTITASELFGRLKVMPVVESFVAKHPGARMRVLLLNRLVNLVDEGVDVAVRIAQLPDSSVKAVGIGELRKMFCASPAYIERFGNPKHPADLQHHACIGTDGHDRELWRFLDRSPPRNKTFSVPVEPHLVLNSAGAAVDAALRGSGISQALSYQIVDAVADGRLLPVLTSFEPKPVPAQLIFHTIPRHNAALRAFIDHAVPLLRQALVDIEHRMPSDRG
jgi:DNA-binding transcriptional LysR family regulator